MTTFRDMKIGEQIIAALDENGFDQRRFQYSKLPYLFYLLDGT